MIAVNDLMEDKIKFLEMELSKQEEVFISYQGKPKFVILDINEYENLREYQLEKEYQEILRAKQDKKAFSTDAKTLIQKIENEL